MLKVVKLTPITDRMPDPHWRLKGSGMPVTWIMDMMPQTTREAEMRYCWMSVACSLSSVGSLNALLPIR